MWKGRFKTATDELLRRYSESISFDWRLYPHDVQGSIAHSKALAEAGLITADEQQQIERGLLEMTFCWMAMAGAIPLMKSVSGLSSFPRNCRAYDERLSM